MAGNLDLVDDVPAAQLKNVKADLGDRYINTPAGIIQTLAFPLTTRSGTPANADEGPPGPVHGDQPRADHRHDLPEAPAPPPPTGPPRCSATTGGYKDGLCGDACDYNPTEAKKLIQEGGGLPGGQIKITYNADTGSHKEWVDAVCNSINNALGNDKACVGNPVGTFADFRNQITQTAR